MFLYLGSDSLLFDISCFILYRILARKQGIDLYMFLPPSLTYLLTYLPCYWHKNSLSHLLNGLPLLKIDGNGYNSGNIDFRTLKFGIQNFQTICERSSCLLLSFTLLLPFYLHSLAQNCRKNWDTSVNVDDRTLMFYKWHLWAKREI